MVRARGRVPHHNHLEAANEKSSRLIIDVRQIYKRLKPSTTLDEILNNSKCIDFFEESEDKSPEEHYTITEIECDGAMGAVDGYVINRLYAYTDPAETELRSVVLRSCQIPFSPQSLYFKEIFEIYRQAHYFRTNVILGWSDRVANNNDGTTLMPRFSVACQAFKVLGL